MLAADELRDDWGKCVHERLVRHDVGDASALATGLEIGDHLIHRSDEHVGLVAAREADTVGVRRIDFGDCGHRNPSQASEILN